MSNEGMAASILPDTNDPEELEQYLGSIYPISDAEMAEIDNKHTYHAPNNAQIKAYPLIRKKAKELEILVRRLCPPSRERSVAITHFETGTFWANAAKARNEKEIDMDEWEQIPHKESTPGERLRKKKKRETDYSGEDH